MLKYLEKKITPIFYHLPLQFCEPAEALLASKADGSDFLCQTFLSQFDENGFRGLCDVIHYRRQVFFALKGGIIINLVFGVHE